MMMSCGVGTEGGEVLVRGQVHVSGWIWEGRRARLLAHTRVNPCALRAARWVPACDAGSGPLARANSQRRRAPAAAAAQAGLQRRLRAWTEPMMAQMVMMAQKTLMVSSQIVMPLRTQRPG